MAAARFGDEPSSTLDLFGPVLSPWASDPGFIDNGFRGSGSGNLTRIGGSTGQRPLSAPSRIYTQKKMTGRIR
ncbi:hypothetical protein Hanom_Chr03g00275611 [Helianthus anomalus]